MTTKTNDNDSVSANLRPIFAFLKPYKYRVIFALIALLVTAGLNLSMGQGVKNVIDNGFISGSEQQLTTSILLLISLMTCIAVGTHIRFYLMSWLGERVSADIRLAVFNRIVSLHPSYFEQNRSGEIMSRLTTDTTLLQSIVGSSFSMALRSSLMIIGGLIMLILTNIKLTLIVISCVPLVLLPMFFYGKRVRHLSKRSQDTIADIGTYAGEVIQNIKIVQSYTQEPQQKQAFGNEVDKAFTVAKARIAQRALLFSLAVFLSSIAISAMLWVGGIDVLKGNMSAGDLGAFVFYAVIVAASVGTVAEVYGELQRAAGAASRLVDLLQVNSDIINCPEPQQLDSTQAAHIKFDNINFHYDSRPDTPALKNFSLTIEPGKIIALVGPSGAGKSTVFELLQRFYDPQQGTIYLDKHPLEQIELTDLRHTMGIVPQQPTLFSTNVRENIAFGDPQASSEQILNAAKRAHADEFVNQLPQGYDSFLGEQGVRLSGGQKQRIALARAILKNPRVLLLDEATSALDAQSEHLVQQALNELMHGRTTLIIAHRLATVMHADLIVVMDKGEIVATGDHQSLLQQSPLYQRLCELQFDHEAS